MNSLTLAILQSIVNFFKLIGTGLGLDNITILAMVLFGIFVIATIIRTTFTLELRTNRAVNKLIYYLEKKPYVTEENIVEFNKLMKKVPKTIRYQWQRYMLNRENKPSDFISQKNCIENPSRTSAYKSIISFTKIFSIVIACMIFVFNLGYLLDTAPGSGISYVLLNSLAIPVLIIIFGYLYSLLLLSRLSAVTADLYFNFDILEKFLDRSVESMPEFVDYEILFTKKEITEGIPALQEYLEHRAKMEEQMLQKAKESEVEHDTYNFEKLGVNGSLVMERALKESEYYLGNRRRVLSEIEQISSEKETLEKTYDEKLKNTQRKLRDIREELQRLQDKANTTTNKILANDIRKQQADETKKQQVLEAEMEEDEKKYLADVGKLNKEIDERKALISSGKAFLEKALTNEFEEFSTKVYNKLKEDAINESEKQRNALVNDKQKMQAQIEEKIKLAKEFETLYNEKLSQISNFEQIAKNASEKLEENDKFVQEVAGKAKEAIKELSTRKREFDKAQNDLAKFKVLYDKMLAENKEVKLLAKNINEVKKQAAQTAKNEAKVELQSVKSVIKEKDKEIVETKKQLETRNTEIDRLIEKFKEQQSLLDELKEKQTGETFRYFDYQGKEFYVDKEGKPYHILANGNVEYFELNKKEKDIEKQSKELEKLQGEIEKENTKLKQQHSQLKKQINKIVPAKKSTKDSKASSNEKKPNTKKTTKK